MILLSAIGPATVSALAGDLGDAVLAHINQDRAARGLHPLARNPLLDQSATGYAQFVAAHGWDASNPHGADGRTPFQRIAATGYSSQWEGENLALGFPAPDAVDNAWDHSPEHLANIVFPQYTEVGIGWAFGAFGGAWVEDFGSRASAPPGPPAGQKFALARFVGNPGYQFYASPQGVWSVTETLMEIRFNR